MVIKIAINGFGRIGRPVFKNIVDKRPELEVAAINDLAEPKILTHLLKHDSVYGAYKKSVETREKEIIVDGKKVRIFTEKDPINLPWKKMGIDIVLECTGEFTEYEKAKKHLDAGAKKVIISAPSKTPDKVPSFILGVNEKDFDSTKYDIVDMGSCTTNCLAPLVKTLQDNFGIKSGFMSTVHSYTNDQKILDLSHKDLRRARAAAVNIIPTSTGAAKTIGKIIPELKGKLDGIAFRVPTATVSVLDLVCQLEEKTTKEEINNIFREAALKEEFKVILGFEETPLVSSDYIANSFSAIIDAELTMVIENLVKITAWYDNEWAYACRLAEFAEYIGKRM